MSSTNVSTSTTGATPEEIHEEIRRTQEDIREDLDALQDKLSPKQAARRQMSRVSEKVADVREAVMGTAEESADQVRGTASQARDAMASTPDRVRRRARGNPLAMGMGAFALGWLASALIPASDPERRAARQVKSASGDIAQPLAESARSVMDVTKEHATAAAGELKHEAQQAAESVAERARQGEADPQVR